MSFMICSRYFCMISARACWCSSRDRRSSRFSCCNSRIWRFSCAMPNTRVERGRCLAISFSSLMSSWYWKEREIKNRVHVTLHTLHNPDACCYYYCSPEQQFLIINKLEQKRLDLEKSSKIHNSHHIILIVMTLIIHLNKLEFLSSKDALCQVLLN